MKRPTFNIMDDVPIAVPKKPTKLIHQLHTFIRAQNKAWATEKTQGHEGQA